MNVVPESKPTKTFADLSDEQFIELHRVAWGYTEPIEAVVSHYLSNISVWQVRDSKTMMTEFNGVTGEIVCLQSAIKIAPLDDIWRIVSMCRKWGIDYSLTNKDHERNTAR